MEIERLNHEIGNMDLFLLDQLLKVRFNKKQKILDAGCGEGRNLSYFIRHGYDVYAFDKDPKSLDFLNLYAKTLNKAFDTDAFTLADLASDLPYPPEAFDVVFCISVLHFAQNEETFFLYFGSLWKHLKSGGTFIFYSKYEDLSHKEEGGFFYSNEKIIKKLENLYSFKYLENIKILQIMQQGKYAFFIVEKK